MGPQSNLPLSCLSSSAKSLGRAAAFYDLKSGKVTQISLMRRLYLHSALTEIRSQKAVNYREAPEG